MFKKYKHNKVLRLVCEGVYKGTPKYKIILKGVKNSLSVLTVITLVIIDEAVWEWPLPGTNNIICFNLNLCKLL